MVSPDARFARARVARLATVTDDGHPHVVPIVFAAAGDVVYTAVDGKPKSTSRLRRIANIEAHPRVSLLVDHYDEDWSALWWIRADGTATVHRADPSFDAGLAALRAKYDQYDDVALDGPVIAVTVTRWSAWNA